jgi:hypothetical protein
MIAVAFLALAAAAFGWPHIAPLADKIRDRATKLQPHHIAGVMVLATAALYFGLESVGPNPPGPTPAPDAGPLSLAGLFAGETASEDAALIGAMCSELADEIEFSSGKPDGYLSTGVAVDELRKRTRILRCRGISIGDRQPSARDAIAKYLDEAVGTDGGPLTAEQRTAWVVAYRDLGRAATDAAK